jgi:hypothetical protein
MMRCSSLLRFHFVRGFVLFVWVGSLAQAAEFSIPSLMATPGQWLATTVTFAKEDAQISGVQFDLEWDPGLGVQIAAGRDLANFRKLVYSAERGASGIRVLIAGTDQALLGDGEVIRL